MSVERTHLSDTERANPGEIARRFAHIVGGPDAHRLQSCIVFTAGGNTRSGTSRKSYFQPNNDLVFLRQDRGYGRVKVNGKMVGAHVLALAAKELAANNGFPPEWENDRFQTSHTCGNSRCISTAHVELELADYQVTRDACMQFAFGIPHTCPHRPQCVRWRPFLDTAEVGGPAAQPPGAFAGRIRAANPRVME